MVMIWRWVKAAGTDAGGWRYRLGSITPVAVINAVPFHLPVQLPHPDVGGFITNEAICCGIQMLVERKHALATGSATTRETES
jgi:hypothetical protein